MGKDETFISGFGGPSRCETLVGKDPLRMVSATQDARQARRSRSSARPSRPRPPEEDQPNSLDRAVESIERDAPAAQLENKGFRTGVEPHQTLAPKHPRGQAVIQEVLETAGRQRPGQVPGEGAKAIKGGGVPRIAARGMGGRATPRIDRERPVNHAPAMQRLAPDHSARAAPARFA